jgi:hypothetical protein
VAVFQETTGLFLESIAGDWAWLVTEVGGVLCRPHKTVADSGRWSIRLVRPNRTVKSVRVERACSGGVNASNATAEGLARLHGAIDPSRCGMTKIGIVWLRSLDDLYRRSAYL